MQTCRTLWSSRPWNRSGQGARISIRARSVEQRSLETPDIRSQPAPPRTGEQLCARGWVSTYSNPSRSSLRLLGSSILVPLTSNHSKKALGARRWGWCLSETGNSVSGRPGCACECTGACENLIRFGSKGRLRRAAANRRRQALQESCDCRGSDPEDPDDRAKEILPPQLAGATAAGL